MVTVTKLREYVHQELDKEYGGISGYYIPRKERQLEFKGKKILYVVGHAVIESSCCGKGNWDYVLVPGYIVKWHNRMNDSGLAISTVEPVGPETVKEISYLIQAKDNINCITFW